MRFLTKSLFKVGMECPTKLFYANKPEYANREMDDQFLLALAEGGFQVGELAKQYHPGGHDITALDTEMAEQQTKQLLREQQITLFESAIRYQNLFIRVDVLVRMDQTLQLIEVKAKSYDKSEGTGGFNKRDGGLSNSWREYLYDIAFQTYVMERAMPGFQIAPYLMLVDKQARCSTNGLHQKFRIARDRRHPKGVSVSNQLSAEDLNPQLLIKVPVGQEVKRILLGEDPGGPSDFGAHVEAFAAGYEADRRIFSPIGSKCRNCEYRGAHAAKDRGQRNGFRECWSQALGWEGDDFNESTVLDLWRYRKKDQRIAEGRVKLRQIRKSDIGVKPKATPGLSTSERQWLQVRKVIEADSTPWLDVQGLQAEKATWTFPLHFIDFETTMVAVPFTKNRHPYEGIAFQFSHHTIQEDGEVAHAGEYLNTEQGIFPNYHLVRELKRQLENDDGAIFSYATHENTFLCTIHAQLRTDAMPPVDQIELMSFIRRITRSGGKNQQKWRGARCMVDMLDLVKKYCYLPQTNGSNSLKYMLPAILNACPGLQRKYSQPIYGSAGGIRSHNFKDWKWIVRLSSAEIQDPYHLLPPVFPESKNATLEPLTSHNAIRDGGAAMAAYARTQYEEMNSSDRDQVFDSLRKYCELDTLAMVMLYEGWIELVQR